MFLDIWAKLAVIPTSYLLINFALAEDNICYILLIILFPLCLSSSDVIRSKSLYKESIATTIAMLSQMSFFGIIAALKQLQKNCISKK